MMHIVEAQHIRNYLNWKKKKKIKRLPLPQKV